MNNDYYVKRCLEIVLKLVYASVVEGRETFVRIVDHDWGVEHFEGVCLAGAVTSIYRSTTISLQ